MQSYKFIFKINEEVGAKRIYTKEIQSTRMQKSYPQMLVKKNTLK